MNVSVIGTGYVGLVSGACLADKGQRVVCVDNVPEKVAAIEHGRSPFHEPGLDDIIKRVVGTSLFATTDLSKAVRESDLTLLATGTPFDGKEIDLTSVKRATRQIGEALKTKDGYHMVVVKSTVVPGTTLKVVVPLLEEASGRKAGRDFGVGMNPEFLSEGEAVFDFMNPDRIVLGGIDERSIDALDSLYSGFPDAARLRCNTTTAEMIKYTSNSLLAAAISFTNEIGNLCAAVGGVDIVDVMEGAHLARVLSPEGPDGKKIRAGLSAFYKAGCGFGGSCLPKDVSALIAHGHKHGVPMPMLEAVMATNKAQPVRTVGLLEKHLGTLSGKTVAVLGLSFKPDTDDMRETPAVPIIDTLLARGAIVKAHDPVALAEARKVLAGRKVELCESLDAALAGVDGVVLVTKWDQYKTLPQRLKALTPPPVLVDGRRFLDKNSYPRYVGLGLEGPINS